MTRYPLIDGHNDLALQLRKLYDNHVNKLDLYNMTNIATDIKRLRDGHVQAEMFAVYVLCGAQEKDAVRLTLEQIDVLRRMCTMNKDLSWSQQLRGRIFLNTLFFYQRQNNSLTTFGRAVVKEMNRLGMIIDLSHTSWGTAQAVLNISRAPVIFSHSSSYTVCNNDRNVPDMLLKELKKNQGLIMVNLHSNFISCKKQADISTVADHFDYIKKIIGTNSIGIGSDFEGAVSFPEGLDDVSKYPALIKELLRRNWTEDELADILRSYEMKMEPPSEVQISMEEVHNPCRLVLRHPDFTGPATDTVIGSSSDQHGPSALHTILSIVIFFTLSLF
ncbi:hypothetical protein WMY93_013689 [Mugilogobius chulae]|uniref:Dipeptidase n=1 Tax=Mugilogobius chulae TaxID=88201 RepID=A0AAW0P2E2_9GOBI